MIQQQMELKGKLFDGVGNKLDIKSLENLRQLLKVPQSDLSHGQNTGKIPVSGLLKKLKTRHSQTGQNTRRMLVSGL